MRELLTAVGLAFLLLTVGCTDMFVTKTRLIYLSPEGRQIDLTAGKDYENVDVEWETKPDGAVKARARIGSAGTPAAAMAAVMQLYTRMLDMLERLEKAGAMAGS